MTHIIAVPFHVTSLMRRFIRVPWRIHREHAPNSQWVPPLLMERKDFLNPKKNPFFDHAQCRLWIAVDDDGNDIGRIAAVIDRDWQRFRGENTGFFGLFECIDDDATATALLDHAQEWLAQEGCESVIGPMDMAMHQGFGILIDNFDRRPSFDMPYNPPYYPGLIERRGMEKVKDVYQWGLDPKKPIPERVTRIAERIKRREGLRIRNFDFSRWDEEVQLCLQLYNDAWRDNWGFVPLTPREFSHMAKDLKLVLDARLGIFLEVDGEAVAVAVTVKDLNPVLQQIDGKLFPTGLARLAWSTKIRPNIHGARLMLLGIREDYRRRGLDSVLYVETHQTASKLGYTDGQIGWTLEDNDMVNRAIASMGGYKIGTYRLFGRNLADSSAPA